MTIRQYRTQANLSRAALARALGVNKSLVTRWEEGRNHPSATHLAALIKLSDGTITAAEVVKRRRVKAA